jgi:hypothetical protein
MGAIFPSSPWALRQPSFWPSRSENDFIRLVTKASCCSGVAGLMAACALA